MLNNEIIYGFHCHSMNLSTLFVIKFNSFEDMMSCGSFDFKLCKSYNSIPNWIPY